ncbi:MAG: LuxR C-terminal-related transcriptional regulator [Clostridiales bacterium]|nr:LuxR C-terminal-related transcriptional regulator [Clostridiales bacterium]
MNKNNLRRTAEEEESPAEQAAASKAEIHVLLPLVNSAYRPGHCLETVRAIEDEHERDIAMGEYYYFSGRPEEAAKAMEPYLASSDTVLRLSACLVYAYANLATDKIYLARHALAEMEKTFADVNIDENSQPELRAVSAFVSATASVLLHLPLKSESAFSTENLMLLPEGLRFFSCYVQAHYTYLQGDYGRSIGIVETSLSFMPKLYPIPAIYLRLVAVMDYMSLKNTEKAKEQMLKAWELARPDGLIEALGEHHGLLGGVLEATLKKDWPKEFKRIINITYSFSAGWRKVHNPDTGHDVADNLTTTEFAIAMLAARGWTNQEIGDHMGIRPNTVKWYISIILDKLDVERRDELAKYMLR